MMCRLSAAMDATGQGDNSPLRDALRGVREGDRAMPHEETVQRRRGRRRTSAPPRTVLRPSSTPRFPHPSPSRASRFTLPSFMAACTYMLLITPAVSIHSSSRGDTRPVTQCTKRHPMVGFEADLSMNQHQLRGTIRILDDCTFKVTKFDMLPGAQVYWWGAQSESVMGMLDGFKVSPRALAGTFNSQAFTVTLVNTTWSNFTVLSVWSTATASDYGHIVLEIHEYPRQAGKNKVGQGPAAAPSGAEAPYPQAWQPPPSRRIWVRSSSPPPPAPPPEDAEGGEGGEGGVGGQGGGEGEEDLPLMRGRQQPTMLQNCVQLSHFYRLRWTLNEDEGFVDLALEAAVSPTEYLGFGWADPNSEDRLMIGADMVIAGLSAQGKPFVEDYFATAYTECNFDSRKPSGVCPDSALGRNDTLSNIELLHSQRMDGVTFVRFRRKLDSGDNLYDYTIDPHAETNVIWAHGALRPHTSNAKSDKGPNFADILVPAFHGSPQGSAYGVSVLTLDSPVDDCQSVLKPSLPDLGSTVVADRGTSLLVTSGPTSHFPNPPNPNRTLFINNHEAPVLKVERGVQVELLVQAGHDAPVYITTDPVGGLYDPEAEIFAGGEGAHGVPAEPHRIVWTPNSTTPDIVFYQVYSQPKMGWMVQVVDGGLSDMYSKSVLLAGSKQMTLFWTLTATDVSIAVRGERPSGYLAIAFGGAMINSWSYVGWIGDNNTGSVASYWMDSRDPGGVHHYQDNLTTWKCESTDGIITFEFSRPLKPVPCTPKCHVINPEIPVKVVWAYGSSWTAGDLTLSNMHTTWSSQATVVNLQSGEGFVENLQPVFLVHGFMMFMAFGILVPFGVLAARYLKTRDWYQIHVYTQWSALSVMLLGLLFAVGELQGFDFSSTHAKIGLATVLLGLWQPLNAYFRPNKPAPGERPRPIRVAWQWTHILSGRVVIVIATVALLTGVYILGEKGGDQATIAGLLWAMVGWFATIGALVWFIEKDRKTDRDGGAEMVSLVQNGHINVSLSASSIDEIGDEDTRNLLTASRSDSVSTDPGTAPSSSTLEAGEQNNSSTPGKMDAESSAQSMGHVGSISPRPRSTKSTRAPQS